MYVYIMYKLLLSCEFIFWKPVYFNLRSTNAWQSCCSTHGKGTGFIHLDEVTCGSSDSSLLECDFKTGDNCLHNNDASVVCSGQ